MDRKEYNSCMSVKMKNKKLSKEERKQEFCMAAKECSGKAKTREEAMAQCNKPKLPKGVKEDTPQEAEVPCPERKTRILSNLEIIDMKTKQGEAEEVTGLTAETTKDCLACCDEDTYALMKEAAADVNKLAKRYYLKSEAKEASNLIEAVASLVRGEGA